MMVSILKYNFKPSTQKSTTIKPYKRVFSLFNMLLFIYSIINASINKSDAFLGVSEALRLRYTFFGVVIITFSVNVFICELDIHNIYVAQFNTKTKSA